MLQKLIEEANKFEMVTVRKDGRIIVEDFIGFDDDWEEEMIEIPEELEEILTQLEELGADVFYTSDDI